MFPTAVLADRWELIATDVDGGRHYLDTTTVERPDRDTVIYWCKVELPPDAEVQILMKYPSEDRVRRIKMFRKRKYIRVDKPGFAIQDIPPDTITEAFLERLFRGR